MIALLPITSEVFDWGLSLLLHAVELLSVLGHWLQGVCAWLWLRLESSSHLVTDLGEGLLVYLCSMVNSFSVGLRWQRFIELLAVDTCTNHLSVVVGGVLSVHNLNRQFSLSEFIGLHELSPSSVAAKGHNGELVGIHRFGEWLHHRVREWEVLHVLLGALRTVVGSVSHVEEFRLFALIIDTGGVGLVTVHLLLNEVLLDSVAFSDARKCGSINLRLLDA